MLAEVETCGLHRLERLMGNGVFKRAPDGVGSRQIWVNGRQAPSPLTCWTAAPMPNSQPQLDC
jgi:hypothetical protein